MLTVAAGAYTLSSSSATPSKIYKCQPSVISANFSDYAEITAVTAIIENRNSVLVNGSLLSSHEEFAMSNAGLGQWTYTYGNDPTIVWGNKSIAFNVSYGEYYYSNFETGFDGYDSVVNTRTMAHSYSGNYSLAVGTGAQTQKTITLPSYPFELDAAVWLDTPFSNDQFELTMQLSTNVRGTVLANYPTTGTWGYATGLATFVDTGIPVTGNSWQAVKIIMHNATNYSGYVNNTTLFESKPIRTAGANTGIGIYRAPVTSAVYVDDIRVRNVTTVGSGTNTSNSYLFVYSDTCTGTGISNVSIGIGNYTNRLARDEGNLLTFMVQPFVDYWGQIFYVLCVFAIVMTMYIKNQHVGAPLLTGVGLLGFLAAYNLLPDGWKIYMAIIMASVIVGILWKVFKK